MCFNKEASITFFIFGTLCSLYLIYRGIRKKENVDIISGVLLLSIASMQLIEFFIWLNLDCSTVNQIMSILIILLLSLQPLIYYGICYYFNSNILSNDTKIKHLIIIILGIIASFSMIAISIKNRKEICTLPDKRTCKLAWGNLVYFSKKYTWLIILAVFLYVLIFIIAPNPKHSNYFFRDNIMRMLLIFAIIITFYFKRFNFYTIVGSLWCFLCVFYGLFCIFNI